MNTEKNNNPVKHRKIVRRRTQSSPTSSTNEGENSEVFPIDLIFEILKRLPPKTIAICRCVSNQWATLLCSPHFTKSFLARSSTSPRLLFTLESGGKWHFFSPPQPQNVDETKSVVTAEYNMGFSGDWYNDVCLYVNGFVYLYDKQMLKGKVTRVPVICNPSTGQHISLPKVRAKNKDLRSFFGYDPIENQFKVFCMTVTKYRLQTNSRDHQVLTLGKGKLSWRKIECGVSHFPEADQDGICINGVLYYVARNILNKRVIACFDVKSEKFRLIKIEESYLLIRFFTLINYKGKLGVLVIDYSDVHQLWVLDDIDNEKWSKHFFSLPVGAFLAETPLWETDTCEIVWAEWLWRRPFYVFYYNVERQSVRSVEIKGIEDKLMGQDPPELGFFFTNHVENLMVLQ